MAEKAVFLARSSFFSRSRFLTITPYYISLGNTDSDDNKLTIPKEELDAFRYTVRRVKYFVYLYSYVKIDIRGLNGQTIRVRMFSFLGFGKNSVLGRYSDIIQALFTNFFSDLCSYYMDLFNNGIDFEISGLIFTPHGLKFSGKPEIIPWSDVDTKDYMSYFAIFSKKDRYNYKGFDYWEDWNTTLIYTLTRTILNNKEMLA